LEFIQGEIREDRPAIKKLQKILAIAARERRLAILKPSWQGWDNSPSSLSFGSNLGLRSEHGFIGQTPRRCKSQQIFAQACMKSGTWMTAKVSRATSEMDYDRILVDRRDRVVSCVHKNEAVTKVSSKPVVDDLLVVIRTNLEPGFHGKIQNLAKKGNRIPGCEHYTRIHISRSFVRVQVPWFTGIVEVAILHVC